MKVLQIVPELNAGGVERTTLEIAEALHSKGFVPHVCSDGGRLAPDFEPYGAVLHTFNIGSKNPIWLRFHTKKLIDIIKSQSIDLVHVRSRAPAWPAHAAAKATGKPFITTYHGIYNAKSSAKRRYNGIMARGDLVIANSNFTKAHIIKEHGTDPDKIRVIPRGVDMALFDLNKVNAVKAHKLRDSWGVKPNQKIILLPGRLTRWKGQIIAIEALSRLPKTYVLVLLGDAQGRSDYVQELQDLANGLSLSDRVKFPGHSDDVPTALAAADIVIAPSIEPEAFGRVVAEAQAMMRPVIASAHGGPMETVLPEKTGLLVDPGNAEALATAIEQASAWKNYDGARARKHVIENFSKKQLQDKTLAVYRELLL